MRYRRTTGNEQGFASLVVAMVMILVLSLLTVGFAQLARREQQISLSKQLANQAYYAAEAGVNDAIKTALPQIIDKLKAGQAVPSADECLGPPYIMNNRVNDANGVTYSCVLVNTQVPAIEYSSVAVRSNRSITFSTTGAMDSLTVLWGSADNRTSFRNAGGFPPLSAWQSPAVLQFSLTPLGDVDRQSLINNTFTVYAYPWRPGFGSNTVQYKGPGDAVPIVSGNCSGSGKYPCSVTITGIGGGPGGRYLAHLTNYYNMSNIAIGNSKTSTGTLLRIINGQATIDVTGKARNVLKRVRVNVPLTAAPDPPDEVIESGSICKRFDTEPGDTSYDSATDSSCVLGP